MAPRLEPVTRHRSAEVLGSGLRPLGWRTALLPAPKCLVGGGGARDHGRSLGRGHGRGVTQVVSACCVVRCYHYMHRGGACLGNGSSWVAGERTDRRVRARRERHAVPTVGANPHGVAVAASVRAAREVQPAASEIGRGSSRQSEVPGNRAARLRAASGNVQHEDQGDHRQRDSCSHTAQIAPAGAPACARGRCNGAEMRSRTPRQPASAPHGRRPVRVGLPKTMTLRAQRRPVTSPSPRAEKRRGHRHTQQWVSGALVRGSDCGGWLCDRAPADSWADPRARRAPLAPGVPTQSWSRRRMRGRRVDGSARGHR